MSIAYRIMTVCTGNICRSPMAAVVLRERLARAGLGAIVAVDSTGVSGEEAGNEIDPRARRLLASCGYAVPRHRARQVHAAELFERDLVLAATSGHARQLRALVAAGGSDRAAARVQILLIRAFDPAFADRAGRSSGGSSGRSSGGSSGDDQTPAGTLRADLDLDDLDLDDPWSGTARDFELCLNQIETAADGVVGHVRRVLDASRGFSASGAVTLRAD